MEYKAVMNFWKEYMDRKPFLADCWLRLASYQVFGIVLVGMVFVSGCSQYQKLTGTEPVAKSNYQSDQFYRVSCCQDNIGGVLSFPSFLPSFQVQLCKTIQGNSNYEGSVYLAMHVDCGHGLGQIGDEYYAGKGY